MDGARVGEGRFDRGLRLLRGSWEYLRARPRLLTFPAIAAVALTLAALAVGVPAALLARDLDLPGGFVVLFVVAVCSFPLTAVSTFLNVAFLLMVADEQAGLEPSASRALAGAARASARCQALQPGSEALARVALRARVLPVGRAAERG